MSTQTLPEARFSNASLNPLSDADIRRIAPAVFAEKPRGDVSSKYGFVSTAEMVKAMREHGFEPTHVSAYYRRDPENLEFTKHLIRFRRQGSNLNKLTVGDVVPQIVLVNSHDRSSQFHLFGGLWRLICSNGLLVSEGSHVRPLVVRHTTSAIDGLLSATGELLKAQKFVFEHVDTMKAVDLNEKQMKEFAVQALALRPERAGAIDPTLLLNARRKEDEGQSLWKVYNRVQENLMQGGLRGVTANNRAIITRAIVSVNADLAINSGLWHLAVEAIDKARESSAVAVRAKGKKSAKAEEAVIVETEPPAKKAVKSGKKAPAPVLSEAAMTTVVEAPSPAAAETNPASE